MAIKVNYENNSYAFNTPEDLRNFAHNFAVAYKNAADAAMYNAAKFYAENRLEVTPSEFANMCGLPIQKVVANSWLPAISPTDGRTIHRRRRVSTQTCYTLACDANGNPLPNAKPVPHKGSRVLYRFEV